MWEAIAINEAKLTRTMSKSRSEQAPGSVFHPRDESGKNNCDLLLPFWCNIKGDPEI